jgi:hypothetical protein
VVTPRELARSPGPSVGGGGRARIGLDRGLAGSLDGDAEDWQGAGVVLGPGTHPDAGGGWRTDSLVLLAARSAPSSWPSVLGQYRWQRSHGSARFTAALQRLAQSLDTASGLIDYRQRRQALQGWCLGPGAWREITEHLPPVPGTVQPTLDDRKRQEASAFVWAQVTQGELRFAPRPIEAEQPEPVRETWLQRRGATWFQLSRPSPLAHYAELRKLLIQHAEHLAKEIDTRAETTRCQLP